MVSQAGAEPAGTSAEDAAPLSWRIPPYQPALFVLLTTGCAAWAIYGHPTVGLRLVLSILAILLFTLGMLTLRMHFVVDDEGISVRFLGSEKWTDWSEVRSVHVVSGVRGAQTIRVERIDDTHVDVPPSLLMSARPVTKPTAEAMLLVAVARVAARRPVPPRHG